MKEKNYDYLRIEAKVYDREGNITQESDLVYDCKLFSDGVCSDDGGLS